MLLFHCLIPMEATLLVQRATNGPTAPSPGTVPYTADGLVWRGWKLSWVQCSMSTCLLQRALGALTG